MTNYLPIPIADAVMELALKGLRGQGIPTTFSIALAQRLAIAAERGRTI